MESKKETRGRKPGPVDLNERFTTRINAETKIQFFDLAKRKGTTASEYLKELIRIELKKEKATA
jgi:hypothetical protein